MTSRGWAIWLCFCVCLSGVAAQAQFRPERTAITTSLGGALRLSIGLDSRAPYRIGHATDPDRILIDLAATDLAGWPLSRARGAADIRAGAFRPGWARIVLTLDAPQVLDSAEYAGGALHLRFRRAGQAEFARTASATPAPEAAAPAPAPPRNGLPRIAIDPGHGGIDPGAVRGAVTEKEITLSVAETLAALLAASGRYEVMMTRDTDHFVSLADRVALARAAGADLLLSLHANTVTRGDASGATVHTLSDVASDPAAAAAARWENGADLVAGLDAGPSPGGDVAAVLRDLTQAATNARSRAAGRVLVDALDRRIGVIRSRPLRSAGFRVLRAPDMPSLLIELGFLSNDGDRMRMTSPQWRHDAALAIHEALDLWFAAPAQSREKLAAEEF